MRMDDYRGVCLLLVYMIVSPWTLTSANQGYLVVMPKLFRPNVEEVLSVTILKPTEPIYVEAKLFSKTGHLIAENGHEIFGKGTLKVKTPKDAKGMCTLKICGNCRSAREGSFSFYNSTLVTVEEKGTSVFLQTDKPVYKPGQTVHINVFMTGPDLLPVHQALVLSLLDPNKSQISKWTDLHPLCCGMFNISFPLSEQPVLGTWTLMAQVQGHVYKRQFDVLKYVLPRYEVAIHAPPFVRDWSVCENIRVAARYTFGQAVRGMVNLQVSVHGIGYYEDHFSSVMVQQSQIDGVAAFNVCISDIIPDRFPDHFRGQLRLVAEVSTPDGASVKASDNSCPVNKQLVDLQFSRDTRNTFKPGLPFKGRVLVQYPDGSNANNVTVLVEALVDGIDFSRQSVITSRGNAPFYIPPLPAVSQSLSLNAKVISIDEELVPEYYFSAYLTVNSWYSPSKCHLLIDSKRNNYKVGEEGKFMIHSTCPCNLDMYYEVKARGNIVHSGIHFSRHQHKRMNPTTDASKLPIFFRQQENEDYGAKTCTVFIKFLITHEMAPLSRLLVYYVRPAGEGVADAIVFEAKPDFRNKMSIELSDPDAMPGEDIKLHVQTRPGSCVCLGAVDKSVHLLKPDFMLSKEEIFSELETYDNPEYDQAEYHVFSHHHGHRSQRSPSWQQPMYTGMPIRDAQYAFEECGLLVMTDTVSLQFRQDNQVNDGIYFEGPTFEYQIAQLMAEQKKMIRKQRSRVYFPETWLWKCFNTSTTRKDNPLVVKVPDSITTWVFTGASMSPKHGFSLAPAASLRTFQYFFLDLTLPYSVVRQEQVRIPLTVHNYLHACVRVHLELHVPNTLVVLHGKETLKKFCIGNEETKTLFYDMIFKQLGTQKISATAEAYADSRCCSGILSDEIPNKRFLTGLDSIKKQILVEPEGIPRYYTHSVYFCPNSRIQLSTPNKYQFQYVARPPEMVGFTFNVKAKNDVRVALSPGPKDHNQMLEIVIGGDFNQKSWILRADTGDIVANITTPGILSEEEFRPFWISWKNAHIKIGWGSNMSDVSTQFLAYTARRPLFVEYIGFSTGWGAEGEFTIWERREMDGSGYGEVMYLSLPDSAIAGSAFARAKLTGDLMGPSIHHLDKLLRLPQGCGEQNMANFAPNVYILQYLDNTGQLRNNVNLKAIKLLTKGYQRQLTYKRRDGSYSAFGYRDTTGNTWLSAFVLKTLAQAGQYIYVDDEELDKTKTWLMNRQRPDGSFESVGRLINKEIQSGIPGRIALTAYVLTAIRHVGVTSKMEHLTVYSAQRYLESNANLINDPYTAALTAYALSILNSDRAFSVLKILSQMAIKRNGMTYWRLYHHDIREFHLFNEEPSRIKVSSAEIEIAGYAALAYLSKRDVSSAFPIIKWLTTQRNSYGGFSSTQDTVVALQALSQYAIESYSTSLDMTVSLASTNMDLLEKFELNSNNSDVIQTVVVPSLPARLFLSASGDGCAMFQVEVQYNVPDPTDRPAFDLWIRLGQHQKTQDHRHVIKPEVRLTFETCTKWLHPGSSNMAVMEVTVMTGYTPDVHTLDKLLDHANLKLKRYEIEDRVINFYFDEIRSGCVTCLSFELLRKFKVESGSSVPIRVYDYYEPGYEAEILYNASYIGGRNSVDENGTACSSMFGCEDGFPAEAGGARCSCYRDCHESGAGVCASDGRMYASHCHMDVHACHKDLHLEEMPQKYCEVQDMWSGEGSGDLVDFAKYGSTISWVSFLASSLQHKVTSTPWIPASLEHTTTTVTSTQVYNLNSTQDDSSFDSSFEGGNSLPDTPELNDTYSVIDNNTVTRENAILDNKTGLSDDNTSPTSSLTEDSQNGDEGMDSKLDNVTVIKGEDNTTKDDISNQTEQLVTGENITDSVTEADVQDHTRDTDSKQSLVYRDSVQTQGPILKVLKPTTMMMWEQKSLKAELKQAENDWKSQPLHDEQSSINDPGDVPLENSDIERSPSELEKLVNYVQHQDISASKLESDDSDLKDKSHEAAGKSTDSQDDVPDMDEGAFQKAILGDQAIAELTDADIERLMVDGALKQSILSHIGSNLQNNMHGEALYIPPIDDMTGTVGGVDADGGKEGDDIEFRHGDVSDGDSMAGNHDIIMDGPNVGDADDRKMDQYNENMNATESETQVDKLAYVRESGLDKTAADVGVRKIVDVDFSDLETLSDKELLDKIAEYDGGTFGRDGHANDYVVDDDLGESFDFENAQKLYGMVSDVVGEILNKSTGLSSELNTAEPTDGSHGDIDKLSKDKPVDGPTFVRSSLQDLQVNSDESTTVREKHKSVSSITGDSDLDTGQAYYWKETVDVATVWPPDASPAASRSMTSSNESPTTEHPTATDESPPEMDISV